MDVNRREIISFYWIAPDFLELNVRSKVRFLRAKEVSVQSTIKKINAWIEITRLKYFTIEDNLQLPQEFS